MAAILRGPDQLPVPQAVRIPPQANVATPGGDDAAERLFRRDSRVVCVRPALDGDDWNDMRRRDLEGNLLEIDDRLIS